MWPFTITPFSASFSFIYKSEIGVKFELINVSRGQINSQMKMTGLYILREQFSLEGADLYLAHMNNLAIFHTLIFCSWH